MANFVVTAEETSTGTPNADRFDMNGSILNTPIGGSTVVDGGGGRDYYVYDSTWTRQDTIVDFATDDVIELDAVLTRLADPLALSNGDVPPLGAGILVGTDTTTILVDYSNDPVPDVSVTIPGRYDLDDFNFEAYDYNNSVVSFDEQFIKYYRIYLTDDAVPAANRADLTASVARIYFAAFDRLPDDGGLQYWVNRVESGTSLQSVAAFFAASPEFQQRFGADLTTSAFVDQLYQNVLGRAGEPGGRDFWITQLNGGMARADVLLGFAESPENVAKAASFIDDLLTGGSAVASALPQRDASFFPSDVAETAAVAPASADGEHWESTAFADAPAEEFFIG